MGETYWGVGGRMCDNCAAPPAPAVLFCRADAAFLCRACDSRVHRANKLASRHERVFLCEVCEQAPASLTCRADAACLCSACDSDIHSANPLAGRHLRLPIAPFADDGEDDLAPVKDPPAVKSDRDCFSDVDPYLDLEYASSLEAGFHQPGNAVAADGGAPASCVGIDFVKSKEADGWPVCHSASEAGVVPDGGERLVMMDREARVMRYREKRKNRRFEKTIRYASRKAYAETRPRIKGRFAKRKEVEEEIDEIYSSAAAATAAFMKEVGCYGVVPYF